MTEALEFHEYGFDTICSFLSMPAGPSSRNKPVNELQPGPPFSHRTTCILLERELWDVDLLTDRVILGVAARLKKPLTFSAMIPRTGGGTLTVEKMLVVLLIIQVARNLLYIRIDTEGTGVDALGS